jgi:hypothetical protein
MQELNLECLRLALDGQGPQHSSYALERAKAFCEFITGETAKGATMPDVFEGKPDARQATASEPNVPVSRFRPRYRALTDEEKTLHDAIKGKAEELAELFEQVKPGRYRALGLTALEEAVMWTVKELTA